MMASENYDLLFLDEMTNWLDDGTRVLEESEKQKNWDLAVPFLFRIFHSLKGAAPMAGMPELGVFLHRMEDLLSSIQQGSIRMDKEWSRFLLTVIDCMYIELEAARQGESLLPFIEKRKELVAKLPGNEQCDADDSRIVPTVEFLGVSPGNKERVVATERLVILCFDLIDNVQMQEVAVLVLEKQYQEVGRVLSMVAGYDGGKPVIVGVVETSCSDSELKKIAVATEVKEVYIQPFYGYCLPVQPAKLSKDLRVSLRILLVDDDVNLLMLMWKELEKKGYSTVAVTTAEEALQLVESEKFHIVISDVSLPGLNGLELIRLVKKRDVFLQVIVMTDLSAMQNAVQALELGAVEYLVKPFVNMSELVQAVEGCEAKLAYWWLRLQEISTKKE